MSSDDFGSLFKVEKKKTFKEMAEEINAKDDEIVVKPTRRQKRVSSPIKKLEEQLQVARTELAIATGRIQVLEEQLIKARRFPQWKEVLETIITYKGKSKDMLLLKNQAGPKNSNQKFMWRLYSLIHDMYVGAQE